METNYTPSIEQKRIIDLLEGTIKQWNKIEGRQWTLRPNEFGRGVELYDASEYKSAFGGKSIHGSLVHAIGQLSDVFNWTWAIYQDKEVGLYVSID